MTHWEIKFLSQKVWSYIYTFLYAKVSQFMCSVYEFSKLNFLISNVERFRTFTYDDKFVSTAMTIKTYQHQTFARSIVLRFKHYISIDCYLRVKAASYVVRAPPNHWRPPSIRFTIRMVPIIP